jgi:nicotinamidase/pyrazinamidase
MSCHYKPYSGYKLSYVPRTNKISSTMSGGKFGGPGKSILLVIDVQNDFLPPSGSLAVLTGKPDQQEQCDAAINKINNLVNSGKFDVICYTQDAHPPGHISFASTHGKKPYDFDTIPLKKSTDGSEYYQVLWPDHCRSDGEHQGMNFPQSLKVKLNDGSENFSFSKGQNPHVDSYSAFKDAEGNDTGLHTKLISMGVTDICVSGIARDFCVWWTARDATTYVDETGKRYFNVIFAWDATLPVPGFPTLKSGAIMPDYDAGAAVPAPHQRKIAELQASGLDYVKDIHPQLTVNTPDGNKWVEACLSSYGILTLNTDVLLTKIDDPSSILRSMPPPPSHGPSGRIERATGVGHPTLSRQDAIGSPAHPTFMRQDAIGSPVHPTLSRQAAIGSEVHPTFMRQDAIGSPVHPTFMRQAAIGSELNDYSPTSAERMTDSDLEVLKPKIGGGLVNKKPVFRLTPANSVQNTLDLSIFRY